MFPQNEYRVQTDADFKHRTPISKINFDENGFS